MFWLDERKPNWKLYLEDAPEHLISRTGLDRGELERILDILHEERIIN